VPALRLCYVMSFSFKNTEAVLLGLGEAGVIPRLGKFLALEDERGFALRILHFFESREEYYPQLLSIGLANLARVSHKCESLFKTLCHRASPAQLIPVFSFFLSQFLLHPNSSHASQMLFSLIDSSTLDLTQVLPHLDVGKILCALSVHRISLDLLEKLYKLLSSVYLRDSGAVTGTVSVIVIVTDSRLSCWQSFLSEAPEENLRLELICPMLLKIVASCPNLKCLIDHRLISSLLARIKISRPRDPHFLRWLLDLIDHALTVRARASEEGGREKALLLIDHLVDFDLGILSLLTDSLSWISAAPLREYAPHVLQQLFRFGKSHEAHFKETPMMTFLSPLFAANDGNAEGEGERPDQTERRVGEQCETTAEDSGVVNSKREKEGKDESLSS
jgi:hypothetical protein